MRLLIMGTEAADYVAVCDFRILGYLVSVNKNQVPVPLMSPMPCKMQPLLLEMALLHLVFNVTITRWRYYYYFPVLVQMNLFVSPGWMLTSPVSFYSTDQFSPDGCNSVSGFMMTVVVHLIVSTWFYIRLWTCMLHYLVLYL